MEEDSGRFLYSAESFEKTPSLLDGVTAQQEMTYRQKLAMLMQTIGTKSNLTQLAVNTSVIYMHRFFMYRSVKRVPRMHLAIAFVFAAGKVEESARKLEHLIRTTVEIIRVNKNRDFLDKNDELTYKLDCEYRPKIDPLLHNNCNIESSAYLEMRKIILDYEIEIYSTIGFHLQVVHPHNYVIRMCAMLGAENIKDISQYAYNLATASSQLTMMCLKYKPELIATVCLNIASIAHNIRFVNMKDQSVHWYQVYDTTTDLAVVEAVTTEFMSVIKDCSLLPTWMTSLSRHGGRAIQRPMAAPGRGGQGTPASQAQSARQSALNHRVPPPSQPTDLPAGSAGGGQGSEDVSGRPAVAGQQAPGRTSHHHHQQHAGHPPHHRSHGSIQHHRQPGHTAANRPPQSRPHPQTSASSSSGARPPSSHPSSHRPHDPSRMPNRPLPSQPHDSRPPHEPTRHQPSAYSVQQREPDARRSHPGLSIPREEVPSMQLSCMTPDFDTSLDLASPPSSPLGQRPTTPVGEHSQDSNPPPAVSNPEHSKPHLAGQSTASPSTDLDGQKLAKLSSQGPKLSLSAYRERASARSKAPPPPTTAVKPDHSSPVTSVPPVNPAPLPAPGGIANTMSNLPVDNPRLSAKTKPELLTNVKPESSVNAKPESSTNVKSESLANVKPESLTNIKSESSASVKPEPSASVKPESLANVKPESSASIKPDPSASQSTTNSPVTPVLSQLKRTASGTELSAASGSLADATSSPRSHKIKLKRDPATGERHAVTYTDSGLKIKIKPPKVEGPPEEAGPSGLAENSRSSTPFEEGEIVDSPVPSPLSGGLRIRLPVPKSGGDSRSSSSSSRGDPNGVEHGREHRHHHHRHHHKKKHSSSKHARHGESKSSKRSSSTAELHDGERPSKSSRVSDRQQQQPVLQHQTSGFSIDNAFNTSLPTNLFDDSDGDVSQEGAPGGSGLPVTPTVVDPSDPPEHRRFHQILAQHRAELHAKRGPLPPPPIPPPPLPRSSPPPPPPPPPPSL